MGAPLDPEQQRAQRRIDDLRDQRNKKAPKVAEARQQLVTYRMQAHPDPRVVAAQSQKIGKLQRELDDLDNDIRNLKLRHGLR